MLWRVPLDWGDQLVVARRPRGRRDAEEPAAQRRHRPAPAHPAEPRRLRADEARGVLLRDYGEEPARARRGRHPLRYGNRVRDVEPTLPGDYWVAVACRAAATEEPSDPIDVPVDLDHRRHADRRGRPDLPGRGARTRAAATGRTATRRRRRTSSATASSPRWRRATRSRRTDERRRRRWWGPRRARGPRRRRGQPGLLRGRRGVADPASRRLSVSHQQPAADDEPEQAEDQQQHRREHAGPGRRGRAAGGPSPPGVRGGGGGGGGGGMVGAVGGPAVGGG